MSVHKSNKIHAIEVDGKEYILPPTKQLVKDDPVLKTPDNGDWYIYYNVWDFTTGKWKPQKWYSKILNKRDVVSNKRTRKINAEAVLLQAEEFLNANINPKTHKPISPFIGKDIEEVLSESLDDSPIPSVRKAIDEWLLMKSGKDNPRKAVPENKENTEITYKYFFNKFLTYCERYDLDKTRLDKVPKHKVHQFFEERYRLGEIGDLTWNVQLGYIQGMFAYYAKKFDYKDNIANIDDKEDIEDSERFEPFSPEQLKVIFDYLDTPHVTKFAKYEKLMPSKKLLALVARTIYYSFIRISEMRRIKIKNVKNYKKGFFNLTTGITKTKKKIFNDLYLDPKLVEEYSKLGWEKYFNDKKYDDYYVFTPDLIPSPEKTSIYKFSREFHRVLVKLNIIPKYGKATKNDLKYSLYSMKATGNIDAYNSGWDLLQISLQNRHTTTKQTETYLRKLKCDIAVRDRPKRGVV